VLISTFALIGMLDLSGTLALNSFV